MKLSKKAAPAEKGSEKPKASGPFGLNIGKGAKKDTRGLLPDPETYVFTPTIPKVNTIPASVTEKYEIKGVVKKFMFAGVVIIAVLALAVVGTNFYAGTLNSSLDEIKAEEAALTDQVNMLLPYEDYKNAVDAKRNALSQEVSTDINMGTIYGDIYNTAQRNGISFSSVAIRQAVGEETVTCANPEPFDQGSDLIGCITLDGSGANADAAKQFIAELRDIDGGTKYAKPFLSSVSQGENGATFQATVGFTPAVYTQQYARLALPLADLLASNTPEEAADEETTNEGSIEEAATYVTETAKQAKLLVPELTDADLSTIDALVTTCSEDNYDTVFETIQDSVVLASDGDVSDTLDELSTVLATECEGV